MKRIIALTAVIGAVGLGSAASASAAEGQFLCPIVGDGVVNADAHNGDRGVAAIAPPAGTSLLPGKNRAGANANENAYNEFGGPTAGNSPGTPGFTPIWNP